MYFFENFHFFKSASCQILTIRSPNQGKVGCFFLKKYHIMHDTNNEKLFHREAFFISTGTFGNNLFPDPNGIRLQFDASCQLCIEWNLRRLLPLSSDYSCGCSP